MVKTTDLSIMMLMMIPMIGPNAGLVHHNHEKGQNLHHHLVGSSKWPHDMRS